MSAAFLIDFPVHWVLYTSINSFINIEPYPKAPEEIIAPFFRAFAFVYVSYLIAPRHKKKTAFIFMIFWMIVPTLLTIFISKHPDFDISKLDFKYYGIPIILGFIGAVCGYITVLKQEKENQNELE